MRTSRLLILLFLIFGSYVILHAQIPAGSAARTTPTEVEKADVRVDQIIVKAEEYFRRGKLNLQDNRREQARDDFDKAVDAVLESGLDVRANQRLQTFYLELVERVYREEVLNLRVTPRPNAALIAQNAGTPGQSKEQTPKTGQPAPLQLGFRQQQFEPSPLDALSKLILTPEELEVSSGECSANVLRTINVRGLHLGMTLTEVKRHLPGLKIDPMNEFGFTKVLFGSSRSKSNQVRTIKIPALRDIQVGLLKFLDSRVTEIAMVYDNSIKWNSSEEFASVVSKRLGLRDVPVSSGHLRTIKCGTVTFLAGLERIASRRLPVIYLYDRAGEELMLKRIKASHERQRAIRARLEEEKKKSFKP